MLFLAVIECAGEERRNFSYGRNLGKKHVNLLYVPSRRSRCKLLQTVPNDL